MVQGNQTDLGGSRGRFRTMLSRRGVMTAAVASAVVALTKANSASTALAAPFNLQAETTNSTIAETKIAKNNAAGTAALTITNANGVGLAIEQATPTAGAGPGININLGSTASYGVNSFASSAGVFGQSASSGGFGVKGQLFTTNNGAGVYGTGTSIGVWGDSAASIGVQGSSSASHGVYGSASAAGSAGVSGNNTSASGSGLAGSSGPGIGVSANSTSNAAVFAVSGSGTALIGRSTTGKAGEFFGDVEITGNFTASGMKSAAVKVSDGSVRRMYCLESPVSFFEDFGTGQVTNGHGGVTLDPMFLSTVSTDDYQVYLTPEGDCRGLFVESKGSGGFAVAELMGGSSTVKFSWRVVAKRTGIPNERFAPVSMSTDPSAGPKPLRLQEITIQHVNNETEPMSRPR